MSVLLGLMVSPIHLRDRAGWFRDPSLFLLLPPPTVVMAMVEMVLEVPSTM